MFRPAVIMGLAIAGAGLVPITPMAPALSGTQHRAVRLTGGDSLGDGTAMIVGASSISTPGQAYADAAVNLYLHGFTGNTQIITTPEGLYPFLGPGGEMFDPSVAQGAKTLVDAINDRISATDLSKVTPENPVVVFGYSQGADVETSAMEELSTQHVPGGDVHFVMIGDPANPDGGLLERMNLPGAPTFTIPSLGLTFSGATPDDLYPTDIYTNEYDLFADFPKYPIDFLADLNAVLGVLEHGTYLGLTPADVQDATELPTTGGMTDYFMMPAQTLPLLAPLQLIPFIGNPLVDLLQPDLSVLVNLGYGNTLDATYETTDAGTVFGGWDGGAANVGTPIGFLPDAGVLAQVPQALLNGLQKGVTDAFRDLTSPSNYVYSLPSWAEEVGKAGEAIIPGTTFSILSPVPTTLDDLFGTFPPHTGVPPLDVATALLFTLPELDYREFTYELAQGNLLDAIGIPLAADLGILPLATVGALL